MNQLQKIQDIFRNNEAFHFLLLEPLYKEKISAEIENLVTGIKEANRNPSTQEKNLKEFKNNISLMLLSFIENRINDLIHDCFEYIRNKIDIVANENEIRNYLQKTLITIDEILHNIETQKKELPFVELKFCLSSSKIKSPFQFINFNETAKDSLGIKKQDVIKNLRVFHYPDFNFAPESDEFFALCLQSTSKKIKILREGIEGLAIEEKLPSRISSNIESNGKEKSPQYNTQIFTSYRGFKIFEAMIKGFPVVNDNYGFIFQKLIEDKFMYRINQSIFKNFVNAEPYKITIDKIKTLNVLNNEQRLALYSSILGNIK